MSAAKSDLGGVLAFWSKHVSTAAPSSGESRLISGAQYAVDPSAGGHLIPDRLPVVRSEHASGIREYFGVFDANVVAV